MLSDTSLLHSLRRIAVLHVCSLVKTMNNLLMLIRKDLLSILYLFFCQLDEILLCRNATVDGWVENRKYKHIPTPRMETCFYLVTEEMMKAFDSFRD